MWNDRPGCQILSLAQECYINNYSMRKWKCHHNQCCTVMNNSSLGQTDPNNETKY